MYSEIWDGNGFLLGGIQVWGYRNLDIEKKIEKTWEILRIVPYILTSPFKFGAFNNVTH